ncbi:Uncharacterized protein TCM_002280 [Theobroma cacao]|uniref:Reverse transcriptase zinc-binding domain-containing protein n=1 Tax=Theobroma cacao TaxID=3641 RepID=A0A061DKT4_THECC|nr:Uncharacterized protein TCM_002280 [Theobroma cacao]
MGCSTMDTIDELPLFNTTSKVTFINDISGVVKGGRIRSKRISNIEKKPLVNKPKESSLKTFIAFSQMTSYQTVISKTETMLLSMKLRLLGTLESSTPFGKPRKDNGATLLVQAPPSMDELKDIVWSCDGFKALDLDSFNLNFYKKNWVMVKHDLFVVIADFMIIELMRDQACQWILGDGATTFFWLDKWTDDVPLCSKFPHLFSLVVSKEMKVTDAWNSGSWSISFKCKGDKLIWRHNSKGTFSVETFYSFLDANPSNHLVTPTSLDRGFLLFFTSV